MDAVSAANGLVDTSLKLYDRLSAFYKKHRKLSQGVASVRSDLRYIEEAIRNRSRTADRDGIRSWVDDLRRIKLRIEDAVEYYELEFISSHISNRSWIGARAVDKCRRFVGPERILLGYLDDIKRLTDDAMMKVNTYLRQQQQLQDDQRTSGDDEDYHHPKEADPVGLETATREIVRMLSDDAMLLRVVAISGPDSSSTVLAEAAYNQVQEKEEFQCKAWVTASHDAQELLLKILYQLGGTTHQEPPNLIELRKIVKNFLTNERYIIGICGVETKGYWNDVRCAFPDDNTSSRIIVTTIKEEIAQACRKNCTVYSSEATKADIVQMLSMDKAGGEKKVVAILGPPGCGKSTVAEAAFKKIIVEEEFKHKAWSRATQNAEKLLRDILDQLGAPQPDSKDAVDLGDRLRELLTGTRKRYIIGIDGLETTYYWNTVRYACPDDNTSSRIILTTTKEETAQGCSNPRSVYKMPHLEKTSAQNLLVRKVFGKDGCHNNLREDLNIILETCEYLPLAVANTGDYMRELNEDWDNAKCEKLCVSLSSLLVSKKESFRGMRHVLNRSYTSLTEKAKACLLSLSSYPNDLDIRYHDIKDHVIKAKPLIRRLTAEKLVTPATDDELIDECLTPLIDRNFIVPTEFSSRGLVKTFRVNRMLPQFIKVKSDLENYVTRIDIQQGLEVESQSDITRLYLHNTSSSESPGIREKIDLTRVRLLTFHGKASKALMRFNDHTFLRVLILENCEGMKDDNLDSVCSPRMLKYLSIRGNKKLTKLPKNIENMLLLETLDTRDTTVHMLPMDVILLPKLAHLFGEFKISFEETEFCLLSSQVKSCQLQTLAGFFIDESPLFIKLLPFMPKLIKVKILHWQAAHGGDGSQTKIYLNDKVQDDLVESLRRCLSSNRSAAQNSRTVELHSLSFDFGCCDLDFLNHLYAPSFLPSLKVRGKLTILPKWITSLHNLTELCLSGSNIGHLSELRWLKKLVFLKLTGDSDFGFKSEEYIWHGEGFKSLKRLHLDFPYLPKVVIQEGAMPKLKFLQLSCRALGDFDGIENLRDLEELILPSADTSAQEVDLLNQVKRLPRRPVVSRSGSIEWRFGLCKEFPRRLPS